MTNAEKFQKVFGYYATEMWAKPEKEFLEWINAEALEKEPSCRNTRQVDLISRQDAIDALDDIRYTDRQDWWAVLSTVENLPPATKPKRGKWIYAKEQSEIVPMWECSCCRIRMPKKFNYCPNCGADMRGNEK